MTNQAQKNLLEALKLSLFGIDASYSNTIDWTAVVKEAKAQTVLGLISPVIPIHDESSEQGKAYYMQLLYEQDKLINLLENNNIPCVILKGCAAAVYYPKPYLRTMGDVDFLVPQNKLEKTMELMESSGYIYDHGKDDNGEFKIEERHIAYSKNRIIFELHHHFSSPGFDIDDILEKAINRRKHCDLNGYKIPILPEIENGLVLIGHINHHLKYNNLGLRQIVDWEMYLNLVMDTEKWEHEFAPLSKKVGLYDLAVSVTKMCEKYLGLSKIINENNIKDKNAADDLLDNIMTDGNFGRKNTAKHKSNEEKFGFVAYSIKTMGLYPYLQQVGLGTWSLYKKHKWLKPFAFIYAFFRLIRKGIAAALHTKNVNAHIKAGTQRYEKFKKIGIRSNDIKQ